MIFMVLEVEKTGFSRDSRPQTSFWMLGMHRDVALDICGKKYFSILSNSKIFVRREQFFCAHSENPVRFVSIGFPIDLLTVD